MDSNLLPAYAVFRVLAEKKTSLKEVLLAFVFSYIIKEYKQNRFLIKVFTPQFNEYYGFDIPSAVIKNLLVGNKSIRLSKNGWYEINKSVFVEENIYELDDYRTEINRLISDFLCFAKRESDISEKELTQDFITYFSGSENERNNTVLISKYILSVQDSNLKQLISDLNYGSIIYRGITMDLSGINSWNKDLVIYLNTDILFDIFGLNGTCYQHSVFEFLQLVDEINSKKQYIKLKYTNITREEIERFFKAAENIKCSNTQISQSDGMDYLLSLCNKSVDVIEKKALFFSELNKYHIEYDEVNKIPIRVHIFEDETKKKEYIDRNFSFFDFSDDYLNFIEGLRNKLDAKNFSESKHVFLTRTEKILAKAKERNNLVNGVRLAFSLEYVITFLWFNLNKGFGVTELKSLDIFLKSKKIYAGFFADKKMQLIQDAENAYKNREFTKEQVYEVIALFKEKSTRPEDITSESLDEMDGLSNQSINQILESHELQKQNTQKQIDSLKESNEKKDKQLNQNSEIIQAKQQEIKALEKKIADNKEYAELGKKVQPLIDGIKYIKKIISLIAIWVLLPVVVTVGAAYVLKFFQNEDKLNWEFICSNSSSLIITFLVTEAIPLWIACVKKWKKNKK